ncbi:hypothetical protein KKG71_04310 [Patescibacteria group bacterium]|nr:hypothetical protein [Patescibacteria group bacterium]
MDELTVIEIKRFFVNSCKDQQKMGIEVEKIGLRADKNAPPRYRGRSGYLAILGKLYEELGWQITKQTGRYILQMQRGGATLNLESDGRIELAGSQHDSMHDLVREFMIHQNEVSEISKIYGIYWLGIGYHPFSTNREIEELPEERKIKLANYFKELSHKDGNDYALAWFKKTAGIHINFDYDSEEDFARKSRVLVKISPILSAIFSCSPFSKGRFDNFVGFRSNVAYNNNLPQFQFDSKIYNSDFGFDAWIEHILSMPLVLLKKNDEWISCDGTFGEYLKNGYMGHKATWDDFDLHMKTFWKDVKVKSVIELRCIDSLPPYLVPSVPAMLKGLIYNKDALNICDKLIRGWSHEDFMQLRRDVARSGLQSSIQGRKLLDIARDLIDLSEASLKQDRIYNYFGEDESVYLKPIKSFVFGEGVSPGEWLVSQWMTKWRKNFYPVIEWLQY